MNDQQIENEKQRETWLPPSLLPQDLALHTLIPLQLAFPPCPSKISSLQPYTTLISLGDRVLWEPYLDSSWLSTSGC